MKRKIKMTKREAFIQIVDGFFDKAILTGLDDEYDLDAALEFFNDLKNNKVKNSGAMTENGAKLLSWMQENVESMSNTFTSKEAAEALFTSGRSIAGSMRKLVADGYVEKTGKNPVQYSLTEAGKSYKVEN
jgi:predicted HTH transcriptional regulator